MLKTEYVFAEDFEAGDDVTFGSDVLKVRAVMPYPDRRNNWTTLIVVHPDDPFAEAEFSFDNNQPLKKVLDYVIW